MTETKYSVHVYDLSIKRVDIPVDLAGGSIKVIAVNGDCFVQLNDKSQDPINLLHVANIKTQFTKFYLSNNVQVGGYVAIVVGKHCGFELTTNIARATHEPLLLPPQNIPEHLLGRVIDTPEIINVWNIENATFRHSFNFLPQTTLHDGLSFSIDGKKMYIIGRVTNPTPPPTWRGKIFEYNLSKAWDISTATFLHSLDIGAQTSRPFNLFFNSTGTLMYTIDRDAIRLLKYTLSKSWNITTATLTTTSTTSIGNPFCIYISPPGYKMYLVDTINNLLNEFNLSVAWDISTATFIHSFDTSQQIIHPINIFLSPDGLKAYITDHQDNKIIGYRLLKAWDITSAVFKKSFDFSKTLTNPTGLFLSRDGKKMYIGSKATDNIYEFDL